MRIIKAWRFYGYGDMRLDEVPMPLLRPDWVLIKVKVVQPSVTEVVAFEGSGGGGATSTFFKGGALPLQLFGHEFSGEVVEAGEGVTSLKRGSRVAVWNARLACGACPACRTGEEDRCQNVRTIGDETLPGCFAEYAAIPARCLVEIPDTISYGEGACIQALTACLKTVALAEIALGDTVVVQGQGAMGIGIMQIARLSGAGVVITTARRTRSLEVSRLLGADHVVNTAEDSPVEAIRNLTGGAGADVVFNTAGGDPRVGLSGVEPLKEALLISKKRGKVVDVSRYDETMQISPNVFREKRYFHLGGSLSEREVAYLVHQMSNKRIRVSPTITHQLEGLEKVPEAFRITGNRREYDAINPAQIVV